jgi:hypothetical protein
LAAWETWISTERSFRDPFTISGYIPLMESEYDPKSEAEAAMQLAVAAHGLERQNWISVAIAWRELARERPIRQPNGTERWPDA